MGRNTFDIEQTFKAMDKEFNHKAQALKIEGDYSIEETGLDGWMSYRYQYKVNTHDYFGYAETLEEARENIIKAQATK
jgi:hypothetical protein